MNRLLLVICCFCSGLLSLHAQDEVVVQPDKRGIFSLGVDNGVMRRMGPREYHGTKSTGIFANEQSKAIWTLDVPQSGRYIVEIAWAVKYEGGEVVMEVDNKKALKWRAWGTWNHVFIISRVDTKLTLPKGKVRYALSMPNQHNWDMRIEMYSVRLIPTSLEPTMRTLSMSSCLGMSLDDMELRFGKSLPETKCFPLYTAEDEDDKDAAIFRDLEQKCEVHLWKLTQYNYIKGAFIDDKCIAIYGSMPKDPLPQTVKFASKLLGGVNFSIANYDKSKMFFKTHVNVKGELCKFLYDEDNVTFLLRNFTAVQRMLKD